VQHGPDWVADAFCRSRLDGIAHHQFGALPPGADCTRIIERAMPRVG
jgi:putative acyl-CoA dehydrogenase